MGSKNLWISKNKKEQGNKGEKLIQELLLARGFNIIRANWRTPHGEVDLVASFGETVFIFEVKTRARWEAGRRALVSWKQKQRLHRAAIFIWQNLRRDFKFFKCKVLVVTRHGIDIRNLPLLYDTN